MLETSFTSASSAGVAGLPASTSNLAEPIEFAVAPFASGEPTVSSLDDCAGGCAC